MTMRVDNRDSAIMVAYVDAIEQQARFHLGVNATAAAILNCLAREPAQKVWALASAVGMSPSMTTRTIQALARDGLVEVTADPHDARAKLVSLTDKAKPMVKKFASAVAMELALARHRFAHPRINSTIPNEAYRFGNSGYTA